MSQYQENYRKVMSILADRRTSAQETADRNRADFHARCPRAVTLDTELAKTAMRIFSAATSGVEVERKVAAIREENERMQAERKGLLASLGLPSDYTDPHYTCPLCSDTGFIMTDMCPCTKEMLRLENLRTCGAGAGVDTQTFDTFSLKYYEDNPDTYQIMRQNLAMARDFAEHFTPGKENLLLMGGTGLGKTHLSTAIARAVIEGGHEVVYETAQTVFSDFADERFRNGDSSRTDKYLDCDLLILDDLGTEFTNSFTVTCLYQIVNTRLIRNRSTVISTNLTPRELNDRYDERLTSRFLGLYRVLQFKGQDVRYQKLAEK